MPVTATTKKYLLSTVMMSETLPALLSNAHLVTSLALAIVPSSSLVAVSIALLPGCICGLLVFPIPNYHNVLCALCSIYGVKCTCSLWNITYSLCTRLIEYTLFD